MNKLALAVAALPLFSIVAASDPLVVGASPSSPVRIFTLRTNSCVEQNFVGGETVRRCSWQPGGLYLTEESCLSHAPAKGSPVFNGMYPPAVVVRSDCVPTDVTTGIGARP